MNTATAQAKRQLNAAEAFLEIESMGIALMPALRGRLWIASVDVGCTRFSFAFFLLSRPLSEAPGAVTRRAETKCRSLGAKRRDLTAFGAERHSSERERNNSSI